MSTQHLFNQFEQALQVAACREVDQVTAIGQELQGLLDMGVGLAVLPVYAPWVWRVERAGGVVDVLTGDVTWQEVQS